MATRIGIAGFGNHAATRMLPVIEANEQLQLAAIWTRSEQKRALLHERSDTTVTANFAAFLSTPMDVVYIASPTGLHFDHAAAVLKAGHHAWVEKPLATTLQDVEQLLAMAEASNRMLAESFMFPWHAQAATIKRILAEGTLGSLRQVSLTFCFPHLASDNFRYEPGLGGGAFLDHGCYLVKALDIYLGGSWTVLGGCVEHARHKVDVSGSAQLRRGADGVIANLNWGFGSTYINEIQFIGEQGRMLVESAFTKPASRSCNIIVEDGQGQRSIIDVKHENPYANMIDGFLQQLGNPGEWQRIRREILDHAETFFALRSQLKSCTWLVPG